MRMYPKVSGLAAWSENCIWYNSLPLGAVVSPESFEAITLCVASLRVFIVLVVYFVIDSVRKLFDTPSYEHAVNEYQIHWGVQNHKELIWEVLIYLLDI
jgi:hypothetical protein